MKNKNILIMVSLFMISVLSASLNAKKETEGMSRAELREFFRLKHEQSLKKMEEIDLSFPIEQLITLLRQRDNQDIYESLRSHLNNQLREEDINRYLDLIRANTSQQEIRDAIRSLSAGMNVDSIKDVLETLAKKKVETEAQSVGGGTNSEGISSQKFKTTMEMSQKYTFGAILGGALILAAKKSYNSYYYTKTRSGRIVRKHMYQNDGGDDPKEDPDYIDDEDDDEYYNSSSSSDDDSGDDDDDDMPGSSDSSYNNMCSTTSPSWKRRSPRIYNQMRSAIQRITSSRY